ncbi:endo-1,4-beta-xylanase 5-like, partial [Vitis vinifera]|uniref:endo-1,4-beta-xylanase 5-like n=1 Tax=Vitis vinifera TaxID=29760 RepID=UPI002882D9CF
YGNDFQCLEKPHKAQYGGGIVLNPELDDGLEGWSAFGEAKIEERVSGGNNFIVAHSRNQPYDSSSQKLHLQKDKLYTFSAWIQVSSGSAPVAAVLKTNAGLKYAGAVVAESGCWSMLKGGLTVDASGPAQLYFESKNTSVEIWVDSISLQPFTQEQWKSHQHQSVEKTRKRNVRLQAIDVKGNPITGATMALKQNKANFPIGAVINEFVINNTVYQNWFTKRFTVATFGNQLKWYSNERSPGKENYSFPDAMLQFCKKNGINVRGHNILWDDPVMQPKWVPSLSPTQLRSAADRRINSVVNRYRGQFIAWDVVNENLHFTFFEDRLGANYSAAVFQKTHQLDPEPVLFLNDYNTLERIDDASVKPRRYLEKLKEIRSFSGGKLSLGIGLEGHFEAAPNLPYVRAAIDTLAEAKVPVWITELDVSTMPDQARHFGEILEEAHAHPAVNGIVTFGTWSPRGCYRMCLTDGNFKNLPPGDVLDKLLKQWSHEGLVGVTNADGFFDSSLFHGDYQVRVTHPTLMTKSSLIHSFKVPSTDTSQEAAVLLVKVSA